MEYGYPSGRVVPDVPVNIGVDHVLSRRIKVRKGLSELIPILRRIYVEKGNLQAVVECPTKGQLPCFTGYEFRDDGPVPCDLHINVNIRLAFDVNNFCAVLGLHPTFRSLIIPFGVEILDVDIGDGRPHIRESPGDPLVVADDYVRHTR